MCHLRDGSGHRDPGVVEYHVHSAEQAERFVGEATNLVEVADIANDAVCVEPLGAQARHGLVERRLLYVCQHDAGFAASQLAGCG